MPPYKRRFVKKRSYRSRSSSKYRRPTLLKRLRTRAYANLRTGGLLAIERKFSDWAAPYTGLSAGGTGVVSGNPSNWAPGVFGPTTYRSAVGVVTNGLAPVALNVLGPGDSGSDRDGRQVINDSIHLRGHCKVGAGVDITGDPDFVINIALVLDTQTNGTGPTGGLVFVNPGDITGGASVSCASNSFVNLANSKRFRILKHIRRQLRVDSMLTATTGIGGFAWAMDVPLKAMKTNYVKDLPIIDAGNGAATVSSIGDNGIFLFVWSNCADNHLSCSYASRLRFRG